jgi:hypothetical protein
MELMSFRVTAAHPECVDGPRPTAMERTLALLRLETGIAGGRLAIPYNRQGLRAAAEPPPMGSLVASVRRSVVTRDDVLNT